jgi:hypothetical protein
MLGVLSVALEDASLNLLYLEKATATKGFPSIFCQ